MAAINAGRFSFYDPATAKGPAGYQNSPLYDWTAELERSAYYANFLAKQGKLGSDMNSDLARSLERNVQQGFEAKLIDDPEAKFVDHMGGIDFNKMIAGIDPGSRGFSPGTYAAQDSARWLPRSR